MVRDGRIQNVVAWWIIGAIFLVDAVWVASSDFQISFSGSLNVILGAVATLGILIWFYSTHRCDEKIVAALSAVLLLIAFTVGTAPLSYFVASLDLPLWDEAFHSWDQAIGLDWRAYLAWMNEHPFNAAVFKLAYQSLAPQMVIVCLGLGLTGRRLELRVFTLAVVMSAVLCVLVSGAMPAFGTYFHLGLKPHDFPNFSPAAPYNHIEHLLGLRDGTFKVFALNATEGIVTFPSYHACLAIIFLTALWSVPFLRWPGVILNLTVIASTPIHGGHYFVDVGAGIVIAAMCLWIAYYVERLYAWRGAARAFAAVLPFRRRKSWAT